MIPLLMCPLCHGTELLGEPDGAARSCAACGYTWITTPALEREVRADYRADREAAERRRRRAGRRHRWLRRLAVQNHARRAFAEGGAS